MPLREDRYDLDAMLEAITPRTSLVFVCHPNNPTGTMNTRAELDAFLDRVPDHVLVVIDQAYLEYVDDPEYPDAIEEYYKRRPAGRRAADVLEDLRARRAAGRLHGRPAGRGHGREQGQARVRRLDRPRRRRRSRASTTRTSSRGAGALNADVARPARRDPRSGRTPAGRAARSANFLYAETGADARPLFEALLAEGVIVRPLHGFGAPTAIRVTCGTADENEFFAEALARVRPGAATR